MVVHILIPAHGEQTQGDQVNLAYPLNPKTATVTLIEILSRSNKQNNTIGPTLWVQVWVRVVAMNHLICLVEAWAGKSCPITTPEAGGRAVPVVIRAGEQCLVFTSCNTQESKPCTLPEKHNRANLVSASVGEPSPKLWAWESCLHYPSVLWQHGCGRIAPH